MTVEVEAIINGLDVIASGALTADFGSKIELYIKNDQENFEIEFVFRNGNDADSEQFDMKLIQAKNPIDTRLQFYFPYLSNYPYPVSFAWAEPMDIGSAFGHKLYLSFLILYASKGLTINYTFCSGEAVGG